MSLHLLALLAASALAAPAHQIEVRVSDGRETYAHALSVAEGAQANYAGGVRGLKNGTSRQMIFNALLARRPGGELSVMHQVEVGQRGESGEVFQVQGELNLSPGRRVVAARCGKWSVTLSAGSVEEGSRPAASPGAYRYTLELAPAGGKKVRCSQTLLSGSQGNVVAGVRRGGKRFDTIMNTLGAVDGSGLASVQIQFQYTPKTAPRGSVSAQSETQLRVGSSRVISKGPGHALTLAVEQ